MYIADDDGCGGKVDVALMAPLVLILAAAAVVVVVCAGELFTAAVRGDC